MGKSLGIAAFVLVLISFPIPVFGTWIGYLALVLAGIAALIGNKTWVVVSTIICAVKMYLLSPGLMATMYAPFIKLNGESAPISAFGFLFLTTFFAALPIVCMICRGAIRAFLNKAGINLPKAEAPVSQPTGGMGQ